MDVRYLIERIGLGVCIALALAGCGEGSPAATTDDATVEQTGELTPVLPEAEAAATTSDAAESSQTETTQTPPPTTVTSTTTAPETTTTAVPLAIPTVPVDSISLDLELVATLSQPIGLAPRAGTDDIFVIEQAGRIVRLPGGRADGADTTLDIRGTVTLGNEQGLLGLAFSPDGQQLYINFTDDRGNTNVARYDMSGNVADAATREILLQVDQPRGNHNGGGLAFGPDGYLYIGMGDGGGGGDPERHGQNPDSPHGAVLRIDVDTDEGYGIPPNNPFVDGQAPEVFVWGIRNAWRFGFDSVTDDLWIADVGQDRFEEVTVLRAADGGGNGANLGWNQTEGTETYRSGVIPDGHVAPVITYAHGRRCSITGGEVYRGSAIPELYGTYIYGDFCSGETFGYRVNESASPASLDLPEVAELSSFGLDNDGNIYVLSRTGGVFRVVG